MSAANVKARGAGRSQDPIGRCMVSSQGACAAQYSCGCFDEVAEATAVAGHADG